MTIKHSHQTSMTRSDFNQWNEQMSLKHDVQDYLENSFFLIRYVEKRRICLLLKYLQVDSNQKVLEMGCGPGLILNQVQSQYRFGVDLSFSSLQRAQSSFSEKNMKFIKSNVEFLPFPSESFERIYCTEVIEHTQNPGELLKEMRRVLKKGGLAVLTVPNDSIGEKCKRILGFLKLDRLFGVKYGGGDEWHIHHLNLKEIKGLLQKEGLNIKKVGYAPHRFIPLRWILLLSR